MNKFILMLVALFSLQAFAAEYLVKYRNLSGASTIHTMARSKMSMLSVVDTIEAGQLILVNVKQQFEERAIVELLAQPGVEYVVPNYKLHSFSQVPVETQALKEQWALAKVQVTKAWERASNRGRRDVVVAVIDTGVDYNHKALAPNMIPGFDFAKNDEDPMDETSFQNGGHGTHCAGVIGATGLVDGGTIGVSPDVSIMPLRFLDKSGSGDLANGIKAIDYAIEKGVDVISASWGAQVNPAMAAPLLEAVKRASDAGIVFVVAAGNSSKNNDKSHFYPANAPYENVINVAASNAKDSKPYWSNYGKSKVHISSPGDDILSTVPNDKYAEMSGTSMATPLVAGVVALIKAQDPNLTGAQIKALIQTTGVKNNIETACKCRIDAFNAVDHLLSKKPLVYPAAATIPVQETLQLGVMNMGSGLVFTSSKPEVLTVNEQGLVTAVANGVAQVTVQDAAGATASTLDLIVGKGDGGAGQCPLGSEKLCELSCKYLPFLSWCSK